MLILCSLGLAKKITSICNFFRKPKTSNGEEGDENTFIGYDTFTLEHTMSTLSILLLIGFIATIALGASYLDAKFQWRLNDWMNGTCSNPFIASKATQQQQLIEKKDKQIEALIERVETLEAIVTEPAYELNQKINALK